MALDLTRGRLSSGDAISSNSLLLGRMVLPYETRARPESLARGAAFLETRGCWSSLKCGLRSKMKVYQLVG
jgi:hypothetical protein